MSVKRAPHRYLLAFCLALPLLLAGCGNGGHGGDDIANAAAKSHTHAKSLVPGLPDFTRLVKKVSPAVVNISALPPKQKGQPDSPGSQGSAPNESSPDDGALGEWLKRFFGGGQGDGPGDDQAPDSPAPAPDDSDHISLGSGFIVSSNGYILTNRHVIAGAGQIIVKLSDRRQLVAHVVGSDADSDIAVLKVNAKNLPTVSIGDSSKLQVGAWVVAIGSPFGFETSVTAGIVSAENRTLPDSHYVPFLQTDVPINPGNSGGPLFNTAGQVVGINSQIYSQTGGYQGVSFAIPINLAMSVAEQIQEHGKVVRGWLGVQIQSVDRKLARSFDLSRPEGALVAQIMPSSPAASSGLKVGDVILSFDGHDVDSAADLPPLVSVVPPGQKANLVVIRNGHKKQLSVKIGALPAQYDQDNGEQPSGQAPAPKKQSHPFGLVLAPLSDAQRKAQHIKDHGVLVSHVLAGSVGARAGLAAGDVILSVGNENVDQPAAVYQALAQAKGTVALLVVHDGARRYLAMDLSSSDKP